MVSNILIAIYHGIKCLKLFEILKIDRFTINFVYATATLFLQPQKLWHHLFSDILYIIIIIVVISSGSGLCHSSYRCVWGVWVHDHYYLCWMLYYHRTIYYHTNVVCRYYSDYDILHVWTVWSLCQLMLNSYFWFYFIIPIRIPIYSIFNLILI